VKAVRLPTEAEKRFKVALHEAGHCVAALHRGLTIRHSSCESFGTGFCVAIIADEGASFENPRFRSLDLTLKGQKVPKSGQF
jgi:hypothetical protein